jgi:hypothetical protein
MRLLSFRSFRLASCGYQSFSGAASLPYVGVRIGLALTSIGATLGAATFDQDLAFLQKHLEVIVLADESGQARVAVAPAYQGRVLTSTPGGLAGTSCGWLNYDLIASGQLQPHMNAFGGEERLWLGPEGGQFSIFFKKGDPFDLAHWQTPAFIDSVPFTVTNKSARTVSFQNKTHLTNYSGRVFTLEIVRSVELLSASEAARHLGVKLGPGITVVGYASDNRLINRGRKPWTKETGLLSIWILGMFNPSSDTTVVVPYQAGAERKLGPIVNDAYFGKVPGDRLKAHDGVIYFKGDGRFRSKIGLSPQRAKPVLGSYDASQRLLTIVQFNQPAGTAEYVNSMWEIQKEPFRGDALNSYNDGPPSPGAKQLGPFYELETSSPAAALKPGGEMRHISRTFHFQGTEHDLDAIARRVLGVSLGQIRAALP